MNMHTMCFSSRKLQTLGTGPLFGPPLVFLLLLGGMSKKSNSTSHFDEFSGLATSLWLLWSFGTASVGGFGQRWSYARLKEFGAKKLGKEVPRKEWRKGGVLGIKEVDEMWKARLEDDDCWCHLWLSTCCLCQSRLDKSEQTSDWSRRPLSEKLVGRRYAWCQRFFLGWYWFVDLVVIRFKTPESRWFFLERTAILKHWDAFPEKRSLKCEWVRPRNITRFFGNKVEETSFYTFFGGWLHWQVGVNHFISHIISLFHHSSWEAPDVVISVGIGGFRPDDGSG